MNHPLGSFLGVKMWTKQWLILHIGLNMGEQYLAKAMISREIELWYAWSLWMAYGSQCFD
jgi:hypothetical protein